MKLFILSLIILSSASIFAQEKPIKLNELQEINILGKRNGFKKVGLYDEYTSQTKSIRGFDQLNIFTNELTEEIWSTKNNSCIQVELKSDIKDTFLHVKWNKDQEACTWVGMGFGWDMWSGKDMAAVRDTIAIELTVRSTEKPFSNIPWAFGFEDYSGNQAWLGYNKSFLVGKDITAEWTKVQIPFSLFPFTENDVDLFNIKQLIAQVFSEGTIEINSIEIVSFSKKLKEKITAERVKKIVKMDGKDDDWNELKFSNFGSNQSFATQHSRDTLFLAVYVNDASALKNSNNGRDLWKGDAIEIAFSTNPTADENRKFFLLSDQHIGINCGDKPYCWNWVENKEIAEITYKMNKSDSGYFVEIAIPFYQLYNRYLPDKGELGFELAIDFNGENESRQKQERWNSSMDEGFNLSPNKWGKIYLK